MKNKKVKMNVLFMYFKSCGYKYIILLFFAPVLNYFTYLYSKYLISSLTNDENNLIITNSYCDYYKFYEKQQCFVSMRKKYNNSELNLNNKIFVQILLLFLIGFIENVLSSSSDLIVRIMSLKGSRNLHDSMLYSLLRSTMVIFFL